MTTPNIRPTPEQLHPSLWRASQLARFSGNSIDTGHSTLSNQLPDNGWPTGSLIELLVQQPGVGEFKLLAPALRQVSSKTIVLLQPPQVPNALAFAGQGVPPQNFVWLKSTTTGDALWAAETVLRSGTCGALMFWNTHVRQESLRRLNLAAQAGHTLFFVLRPLAAAQDPSPSPLRLSLRPAEGGVNIGFVKRRGPQRDEPLLLPLQSFIQDGRRRGQTTLPSSSEAAISGRGFNVGALQS
jgi:protein ImuA